MHNQTSCAHLGVLERWQHQRRHAVWVERMLIGTGEAANPPVDLLRLPQDVLQQRVAAAVSGILGHRDRVWLVHSAVCCELCALDDAEDDGVLLPYERVPDVVQFQLGAEVQ